MLLGAAGIAEITDAEIQSLFWPADVVVVLLGVLLFLGLLILGWTSPNRRKTCGKLAGWLIGFGLLNAMFHSLR